MASWLIQRRLAKTGSRLRSLREELATVDEQLVQFTDDAEDLAVRALVAESPEASHESNDARKHVDAMRRHREHVVAEIAELETRQDQLLDQFAQRAR
jgi:predicted  nucleic acid-binding Zn-ribbon protein